MCHGDNSVPPIPAGPVVVSRAEAVRLRSADGTDFMGFVAEPGQPAGPGVVLLPDFRGLHQYYKDLAVRIAERGMAAVAIDYYGRTATDDLREEGEFDGFEHLMKLTPEQTADDVRVAVDLLFAGGAGVVREVFVLGFCFGGSQAWRQAALEPRLAGVIGFYGRPADCADVIADMHAPTLVLEAGADEVTSSAESESFARQLDEAEVPYERVTYAGAPHSFFDGALTEHLDASADAWRRVLGFIARNSSESTQRVVA